MKEQKILSHQKILEVLREEDQFFVSCHHRAPKGRESEDVVDNAFDRLRQIQPLSYMDVANAYSKMRCHYA